MKQKYTEKHLPEGHSVRVTYHHNRSPKTDDVHKKGYDKLMKRIRKTTDWYTSAVILNQRGNMVSSGAAMCSRRAGDNPSKKIGRAIAVGRALKNLLEPEKTPF